MHVSEQWDGGWLTTNILDEDSNSNQDLEGILKMLLGEYVPQSCWKSKCVNSFLTGQTHTNPKVNTYFSWIFQGSMSKVFIWIDA